VKPAAPLSHPGKKPWSTARGNSGPSRLMTAAISSAIISSREFMIWALGLSNSRGIDWQTRQGHHSVDRESSHAGGVRKRSRLRVSPIGNQSRTRSRMCRQAIGKRRLPVVRISLKNILQSDAPGIFPPGKSPPRRRSHHGIKSLQFSRMWKPAKSRRDKMTSEYEKMAASRPIPFPRDRGNQAVR